MIDCDCIDGLQADGETPCPCQADLYLIWSDEHRAWWRPGSRGYTRHVKTAGRYSRDAAMKLCRDAQAGLDPNDPAPELPVRAVDALECEGRYDV